MKQNKPLLSIAIPTKNRQKYCIEVIKHILSYSNNCFELVVCDNSDDRQIENFVKSISDNRLKYNYTSESISSVQNISLSIEKSIGEYVCMIGDDDTVLPSIFEWAKYMKEKDIDSLCPGYRPEYFWPNEQTGNTGTLKIVQYRRIKDIEYVDPMQRLVKLFKNGIDDFPEYGLPRVYHGIVKKDVLNIVYDKIGSYFGGLSPDIYSAVSLTALVKKHIVIKETISILGACPLSTTSKGRLNSDDGKFEKTPHLINNENYKWDSLIPKYYCGEVIWAETAITAAKDFGLKDVLNKFNRKKFNGLSLANNRHIKDIAMVAYLANVNKKNNLINRLVYSFSSLSYYLLDVMKRGCRKIFLKKTAIFKNIKDIKIASLKFN